MAVEIAENVVGAVIFYAYIAAALFFTAYIGCDLIRLHSRSFDIRKTKDEPSNEVERRRKTAQILVAFSSISFAVLSYHMLMFLILSYSTWSSSSNISLPTSLFGNGGVLDLQQRSIGLQPWTWAKRSTLFQDFAETIVNDRRRYWWTQQALLYSMGWNIFMAVQGTRYRIPHLWAYYVLDQILPISFTQNLFCTAMILSQNLPEAASLTGPAPGDQFIVGFFYLLGLSVAPEMVGTTKFYVILFGIRILLFAPYCMLRPTSHSKIGGTERSVAGLYWQYRYVGLVVAVGGAYLHLRQTLICLPIVDAITAINDNPAVSALGYDYIIGMVSLAVLAFLERF